jgi:hypothetical protein
MMFELMGVLFWSCDARKFGREVEFTLVNESIGGSRGEDGENGPPVDVLVHVHPELTLSGNKFPCSRVESMEEFETSSPSP